MRKSKPERSTTLSTLLERFNEVHGTTYDYSLISRDSIGRKRAKLPIVCRVHGEFFQEGHHHIEGRGCPSCGREMALATRRENARVAFLEKAKTLYGDFYDYSKVVYVAAKRKVEIICPLHGSFLLEPDKHKAGRGCKQCSRDEISKRFAENLDSVIARFRQVHGEYYDYSRIKTYKNSKTNLPIVCPNHGVFYQTAETHLSGSGCRPCSYEWNRQHPVYLYLVKWTVDGHKFFKVGISSDPKRRVWNQRYHILSRVKRAQIVCTWRFNNHRRALLIEGRVKGNIPWKGVNSDIFPDGFSETFIPDTMKSKVVMDFIHNLVIDANKICSTFI